MKIKRVRILNYGKWHHATIPFKAGLNILYGRNEAGKTTLMSFIKGVLFGFLQRRSSHKNYIPRNSKNYGGRLDVLVNGHEYVIQRMAGKNGGDLTILNAKGHQLANSFLSKLLGPFNRETFNALYYFGTVDLQKMGKLKQRDLIYRIQRIGLSHSDEWINYREALNKQAKRLYSPQGYKPPLNQELKQFSRLIDQSKTARASYQEYQDLLTAIKHLKARKGSLDQELNDSNNEASQLKRDQDAWLRYQKVQKLRPVIKRPVRKGFSDLDTKQLRKLNHQLNDLDNQIKLVHQQIHELKSQKVSDDSLKYYQAHQTKIDDLANQFNNVQSQLHQLSLLRDRKADLGKQLHRLKALYMINGYRLVPMTPNDLQRVRNLRLTGAKSQDRFNKLNREVVTLHTRSQFGIKDYLISGISLLMIIVGIVIKLWLLTGLGVIVLGLGFLLSRYNDRQQEAQQIQAKLKRLKVVNDHSSKRLRAFQTKYQYPSLDVESWIANQDNLKRLKKVSTNDQLLGEKISHLQQGLKNYFAKWSFINRKMTLSSEASNRLLQLKNYVTEMGQIIRNNDQNDRQIRKASGKLKVLNQRHHQVKGTTLNFYKVRQIKDPDDFTTVKDQQHKLVQQRKVYQELSNQIGHNELKALKKYRTFDDLKATVNHVNQQIIAFKNQSQQLTGQLTRLQIKLRQMVQNGSYDELQQRIANSKTQINELAKRWLEESLASQWINATLNLATKGRVPKIERQATVNFQTLTNHRYSAIIFNKSKIKVLRNDKQRFTLYELSKGTVQQLYLSLVFAMSQVFSKDYPMPILIDDGFTDFDVSRKHAAVNLLKLISHKLQVIYCTSDYTLVDQPATVKLSQVSKNV